MLNFLLLAAGVFVVSDETTTDLQKSMGTALMGVGLARAIQRIAGD